MAGAWSAAQAVDDPAQRAINQAKVLQLAQHPQWLGLLHATPGGVSEVHSPEFFLSGNRWATPEDELQATLRGFFEPAPAQSNDQHPRCRFPARYLWLSQQLGWEADATPWVCSQFKRWVDDAKIESVSLIVVGAYLGNPASSFGHTMLRLNSREGRSNDFLTDTGLNFGALVPPGVGTLEYVYKGMWGGFQSGFSDAPYYTQDWIYARTEFRDAWDYELALDDSSKNLLIAHLWEVVGKKFDYYFLSRNCAYRMMAVLEAVTGTALTQRAQPWFLPAEAVSRLEEADRRRVQAGLSPWIRAVRFVPSAERVVHAELAALSSAERAELVQRLSGAERSDREGLGGLDGDGRSKVLNAALAYYQYKIKSQPYDQAEASPAHRAKHQVLLERLAMPAHTAAPALTVNAPRSSAPDWRAMRLGLGVSHAKSGASGYLGWAAYERPLVAVGATDPGELVLADVGVRLGGAAGTARLDFMDFIRVTQLRVQRLAWLGESGASWSVALGVESATRPARDPDDSAYRLRARAGYGAAYPLGTTGWVGFAMLDGVVRTSVDRYAVVPHVGVLGGVDRWAAMVRLGWQWGSWDGRGHGYAEMEVKRGLASGWFLGVVAQHALVNRVDVQLSWRW